MSYEREMNDIIMALNEQDEKDDFTRSYSLVMDRDEFNTRLLGLCKSDMQKEICKEILEIRPGWVQNLEIALAAESYITSGYVWGVTDPTDADFAAYLKNTFNISQLEMAGILGIVNKYKEKQQNTIKEWYRRTQ